MGGIKSYTPIGRDRRDGIACSWESVDYFSLNEADYNYAVRKLRERFY